jgi:hypothetical protein
MNRASSLSRAETTNTMGASSSLSPHGYHTPQGEHPHWGGDMGAAPSGRWIENPPQPTQYGYHDDSWYGPGIQMRNATMSHSSPHISPPTIDDRGSSGECGHVQNQHPAGPPTFNWSKGWNAYEQYPTQQRFMPAPLNHDAPQPFAGTRTQNFSLVPAS